MLPSRRIRYKLGMPRDMLFHITECHGPDYSIQSTLCISTATTTLNAGVIHSKRSPDKHASTHVHSRPRDPFSLDPRAWVTITISSMVSMRRRPTSLLDEHEDMIYPKTASSRFSRWLHAHPRSIFTDFDNKTPSILNDPNGMSTCFTSWRVRQRGPE